MIHILSLNVWNAELCHLCSFQNMKDVTLCYIFLALTHRYHHVSWYNFLPHETYLDSCVSLYHNALLNRDSLYCNRSLDYCIVLHCIVFFCIVLYCIPHVNPDGKILELVLMRFYGIAILSIIYLLINFYCSHFINHIPVNSFLLQFYHTLMA